MLSARSLAASCRDRAMALVHALRARVSRFGRWTPAPALPEGALTAPVSDAMALRLLVGPDRLEVWRDRLARAPFRAALVASATLHAVGLAGLMALHQFQDRDEPEPTISITIAPADPDARVGARAGIDWGQPAEQGALSALLEARKGAALLSELVISPPPPSRQPAARRSAAAPPRPKAAPPEAPVDKPREPPRAEPKPPAPAPAPSPAAVPLPVPEGRPTEPVPRPETRPTEKPPDKRLTAEAAPPREPTPAPARRAPAETPPSPPAQASSLPPSPSVPPQPATTQAAAAPAAAAPIPLGSMDKAYFDAVLARLTPLQNHPSLAHLARRHASGLVLVAFTIGRDGTVLDAAVRRSSGYSFLDKAGLDLIRLASPMPALPETLGKETLAIEIPIRFTYP